MAWTSERSSAVGAAVGAVFLVGVAVLTHLSARSFTGASERITRAQVVLSTVRQLEADLRTTHDDAVAYARFRTPRGLERLTRSSARLLPGVAAIRDLEAGNPAQLAALDQLQAQWSEGLGLLRTHTGEAAQEAARYQQGEALLDRGDAVLGGLADEEQRRLVGEQQQAARQQRLLTWAIYGGLAIALVLVLGSAHLSAQHLAGRRRAEQEEAYTHTELDAVLRSLGDGVLVTNRRGEVILHNPAAERMLGPIEPGLTPDDRARRFQFLLPDRVTPYPVAQLPLSRAIRGESCEGVEVYARHAISGQGMLVSVTASPLRTRDGAIQGGVVVFRDVTLQHQMQEELQRSNTELEQFAYAASHDLQEPLRMVASYTQLLARRYRGRLDADADDFIGFAVDGANRMRRLIQDLLAYSRVTTTRRELRPTSAEAALAKATANLRAAIEESGAVVTQDALPEVLGDATQLAQVFQNLVGNAIKYRGDAAPRIHVSARPDDDARWLISVRDNGIGIDPQYFDRIFLLFQRLHGHEQYQGTGIGLTIARKIVERHGGRIWVESAPGEGSCFLFTLPAQRTEWRQTA